MNTNICHIDYKYKICVSGAAETGHCGADAFASAEELGREIVRHDAVLVDGATTGFPFWTAKGVKEEGGIVIGLSPAATEKEHLNYYQLPTEYHDMIIYTGFNYSGRNLLLVRSSDAVIFGCGRMGTLNEFTITFEDKKPIGILQGEWETDELFKELIEKSHRAKEMEGKIVFESDPKKLLDKLVEIIKKEKEKNGYKHL
ncbi:MAG: LOG family protein [Patescibacteria group bacterium]|nr:LOG family protein [Patescibacteria group bacterium]